MAAVQLADKLLSDEHADVLRESVAWMATQLMEGRGQRPDRAKLGERTPERTTHRNGYRPKGLGHSRGRARVGRPKLRQGST
jgi:putative transposase